MIHAASIALLLNALAGPDAALVSVNRSCAADGACIEPAPELQQASAVGAAQQVLAAEREFALRAQRDGLCTAFRATASENALMFVPEMVDARRWLDGRADPEQAVNWHPRQVVLSCDGTLATTTGGALWPDGSHGYFVTIWQKQADDSWKWVADMGGPSVEPLPPLDQPNIRVADCTALPDSGDPGRHANAVDFRAGQLNDGSLSWTVNGWRNGASTIIIWIWDGTAMIAAIGDDQGNEA